MHRVHASPTPPLFHSPTRTLAPLLLAALVASCSPPTAALTDDPLVTGYRVTPTFNAFEEPCTIRYTLGRPAWIEVRIVAEAADGSPALVRQITPLREETRGARTAAWRGIGTNGLFAPQGTYAVELLAQPLADGPQESWTLTTIMYRS